MHVGAVGTARARGAGVRVARGARAASVGVRAGVAVRDGLRARSTGLVRAGAQDNLVGTAPHATTPSVRVARVAACAHIVCCTLHAARHGILAHDRGGGVTAAAAAAAAVTAGVAIGWHHAVRWSEADAVVGDVEHHVMVHHGVGADDCTRMARVVVHSQAVGAVGPVHHNEQRLRGHGESDTCVHDRTHDEFSATRNTLRNTCWRRHTPWSRFQVIVGKVLISEGWANL